jgi:flagellin
MNSFLLLNNLYLIYKNKKYWCASGLIRMNDEVVTEIEKSLLLALPVIQKRSLKADGIATLAVQTNGTLPNTIDLDGVRVRSDRVAIAGRAQFTRQTTELRQAAANASAGASLLDVVDARLWRIDEKLSRMDELANIAALTVVERDDGSNFTPAELSAQERAVFNSEFEALRDAIDDIASSTGFNGIDLLAGNPQTRGNPLDISFRTGGDSSQTVTVSLAGADTEALSTDLVTANLLSDSGGDAADIAVNEDRVVVGDRQAAVRGARAQLNSVETAAGEISAIVQHVRVLKTSPEKIIDLARAVAEQVTDKGGVHLSAGPQKILQDVLLRMSVATTNGGPASGSAAVKSSVARLPVRPLRRRLLVVSRPATQPNAATANCLGRQLPSSALSMSIAGSQTGADRRRLPSGVFKIPGSSILTRSQSLHVTCTCFWSSASQ